MQLQNISYDKSFRNLLIKSLELEKECIIKNVDEIEQENSKDIDRNIFILKNGLISEYDKIHINIEDRIYDHPEMIIETSEEVYKILRLYLEIDGYFTTDESLRNHPKKSRLKFEGFNKHNDEELDKGQINYAEYLIKYEGKFEKFKNDFREGKGLIMYQYKKVLEFFSDKEVNVASIEKFLAK